MLRLLQMCMVLCACVLVTHSISLFFSPDQSVAQDGGAAASQSQNSAEAPAGENPSTPQPPKKPKKVWTNEDLGTSTTPSQPLTESTFSKPKSSVKKSTDPYVMSIRQQLQKLRAQIADINKQITDLDNFRKGNTYGNGVLELHKRYSSEPIDAQIAKLQDKKKQLEAKQEALLDDARKKRVEVRQLE